MSTRFAGSALQAINMDQFMDPMDISAMSRTGIQGREKARSAGHLGQARVAGAGMDAISRIAAAEAQAEATVAQGAAQGQASIASGIGNMVSGIAGGIGTAPSSSASSMPAFGSMPGTPVSSSYMDKLTSFYGA